jgi:hypothetical protein
MPKLSLLFVVVFGLVVNSCSDSTSPDDGGNGDGDKNTLTIVSVDQDSVYWGETVIVTLKNAKTDAFRLFVGSAAVRVESSWRNQDSTAGISFQVPQTASTGLIRVYEFDTVLAKEERELVILPKLRSEMNPSFEHFAPGRIYTGDLFAITGTDIPMRWRDMEVRIGDVPLEIISWDSIRIFTRIPATVKTGPVTLRMFDKVFNLGIVEKLEHTGSLVEEGTLSSVRIYVARVQGSRRFDFFTPEGDTVVSESFGRIPNVDFERTFAQISLKRSGDSLIGVTEQSVVGEPYTLELRLKLEPESRVSGRVRITIGLPERLSFWEAEIKSMRWLRQEGVYIIGTHSIDLPNELVSFSNGQRAPDGITTNSYRSGEATSVINIDLTP